MNKDKKKLIRESALTIFAKEGYHKTTVKAIAEGAGVSVGTVYNYFENKKEILEYIFEVELNKRIDWLERVIGKEISFQQKVLFFLDRHFSELEKNPDTTIVLTQESRPPSKHGMETVDNFMNKLPNLFAQLLEEAKERGEIREVDSNLVANAIFNSLHGMAVKVAKSKDYNFAQAKKELINLYWLGLSR